MGIFARNPKPEITAKELHNLMAGPDQPKLLDVREAEEVAVGKLDIDYHIPLGELPSRFGELKPVDDLVVICLSGGRSSSAVRFLIGKGFTNVRNLTGGMMAWARDVDPSLPF